MRLRGSVRTFDANVVEAMRRTMRARCHGSREVIGGWSQSASDPGAMVGACTRIGLRRGYCIRAYVFRKGQDVYTVPFGAKKAEPFPEPACDVTRTDFLEPPVEVKRRTPHAVLAGDNSPLSYLEASILVRELCEAWVSGHGRDFTAHVLLGESSEQTPQLASWEWLESRPHPLSPRVVVGRSLTTVVFHTISSLGAPAVYRWEDNYQTGNYRFRSSRRVIASGPVDCSLSA